jgi:hypothetical protein
MHRRVAEDVQFLGMTVRTDYGTFKIKGTAT